MAGPIGFIFLLLTTSQLFIRPPAFSPIFIGIPFVQIFIIPCLLFSLAGVQNQLTEKSLSRNPVTVYLLAFTVCHLISSIINLGPEEGMSAFMEFMKALIYYLLVLANVQDRNRVVQFGIAYILFILFSVSVAMANYYHFVDMPGYKQLAEYGGVDSTTGDVIYNSRLSGPTGSSTGDPNDFCLMMLPAIFLSGYLVLRSPFLWQKFLALIPTAVLVKGVVLTQSRGGMLGLLVGLGTLFVIRLGVRKSIPYIVMGVVGLLALSAGRQMDFSMKSGSGQVRIQIWLVCINLIKRHPMLGVGPGLLLNYSDHVAHNSYLQAFTELGLPGGLFFFGVFFSAAWCLLWMRPHPQSRVSPDLWRIRPTMMAIILSTIVSMNAITRTYIVETFAVIGLVSAYYCCLSDEYRDTPIRANFALFTRILLAGIVFLIFVRFKVLSSL